MSGPTTRDEYYAPWQEISAEVQVATATTTVLETLKGTGVFWETRNMWIKGVDNLSSGKKVTIQVFSKINGSYPTSPNDSQEFTLADAKNIVVSPMANSEDTKIVAFTDETSGTITFTIQGAIRTMGRFDA